MKIITILCLSFLLFNSTHMLANTEADVPTAAKKQLKQPIVVDAEHQEFDIKKNTLTFSGNVEIRQGDMLITADTLEIIKGDSENSKLLIAKGQPSMFSQTLNDGNKLSAQATEMRYQADNKQLTLIGNAKISQADSVVTGDEIKYDVAEQKLVASSNKTGQSRVRTVLTPSN